MNSVKVSLIWYVFSLAVCVSLLVLDHLVGFDASHSRTWQLVLYYLLFGSLSLLVYAAVTYLFFPRVVGWWWLSLVLAVLVLVGTLGIGLLHEGAYPGPRDPRFGDLLALFTVASPFAVILFRLVMLRLGRFKPEWISV